VSTILPVPSRLDRRIQEQTGTEYIYQAYQDETPVLNGATKVTGWTQHSGNIYKAPLNRSTKLRNLYVNDKRASMTKKTVTARGGTVLIR
jgi:uncharacterized membrane protein